MSNREEIKTQIHKLEVQLRNGDKESSPLYESDSMDFDWGSLLFAVIVVLAVMFIFCKCSSAYSKERFDSRPSVSANYATRSDTVGDSHQFYFPGTKTITDMVTGRAAAPVVVSVAAPPAALPRERFVTGDDVIDRVKGGISTPDGKGAIEFATEFKDVDEIDPKQPDLHQPELSEDQLRDYLA